jgi:hypothetical protein
MNHALEQLREQGGQNTKLWALQALISRIWPSFFFCAAGLVLINNIYVEFLFVTTSGVVELCWQQGTPMGWRWVVDHFFITHLAPRSMIAPCHHQ